MNTIKLLFLGFILQFSLVLNAQNALHFDGTDDYVQTGFSGISGNSARTVEAWINTTANADPSTSGSQKTIVDWGTFINGQRFTVNQLWGNALRIEVGGNGINGTSAINDGAWHHIAVVFNPSATAQCSLYVDGILENSGNLTVAVNTGTSIAVRIGQRIDGVNMFNGKIDEVRIWNTARTSAEISSNMNSSFCGTLPGLVAYYKFNQGIASGSNTGITTLFDNNVSFNNGTLNNFSLSGSTSNWVAGKSLTSGTGTTSTISEAACYSYTSPSGLYTWTTSNTYMDTIPNSAGCDSVMTINLTINGTTTSSINESACHPYLSPAGNVYNTSGTYVDTIANFNGCDSIITINLTMSSIDVSITASGVTLSANNSNATYQWVYCDSNYSPVNGAISQTFSPIYDGNYAVIITENNCSDTSVCINVNGIGIEEKENINQVDIFPNPATEEVNLVFSNEQAEVSIQIIDITGKILVSQIYTGSSQIRMDISSLNAGLYYIKIISQKGTDIKKLIVD